VFGPLVIVMIVCAVRAWVKAPRHPLTWTTLPFVVIHNLISHKEERFLFPIAIFLLGLVTLSGWRVDRSKLLAVASFVPMVILALYPLGWHHNIRFVRALHDHVGDEVHAKALPEVELGLPAFHPRIYDVQKGEPGPGDWVITDQLEPQLPDSTLVYSELPRSRTLIDLVDAYNARARPPLRPLRFRSLYRITGDGGAR
jgi:phosphatidylinositol glycan class B